jgi:hypothetical protein
MARPARPREATARGNHMLMLHIVGVVALVAVSVAAIADQSTRFVSGQEIIGVHEIPAFISGRVELTPGLAPANPIPDIGSGAGGRRPADLSARQRARKQGSGEAPS